MKPSAPRPPVSNVVYLPAAILTLIFLPLCTSVRHLFLSTHAPSTPVTEMPQCLKSSHTRSWIGRSRGRDPDVISLKRAILGGWLSVSRHTCPNHLSRLVVRIVCMLIHLHRHKTSAFDTLFLQLTPSMRLKFLR